MTQTCSVLLDSCKTSLGIGLHTPELRETAFRAILTKGDIYNLWTEVYWISLRKLQDNLSEKQLSFQVQAFGFYVNDCELIWKTDVSVLKIIWMRYKNVVLYILGSTLKDVHLLDLCYALFMCASNFYSDYLYFIE